MVPLWHMVEVCDGVIIGTVRSIQVETIIDHENQSNGIDTSFVEVQIEQVAYGDFQKEDVIVVWERGNGTTYIDTARMESGGHLKIGDKVLLFLIKSNDFENEVIRSNSLEYLLPIYSFHTFQGRVWLTTDGEIDFERNEYVFSPVIQGKTDELGLYTGVAFTDDELSSINSNSASRGERGETLEEFIGRIEAILTEQSAEEFKAMIEESASRREAEEARRAE